MLKPEGVVCHPKDEGRYSAVLAVEFAPGAEQLLHDARESFRVGEESEALARGAAQDHLVPGMRCVAGSEYLVAFRKDGLAHRRALQCVRMAFVERTDFEEAVATDRAAHAPEDGDPHAVVRRVQGRVPFERFAVDADL